MAGVIGGQTLRVFDATCYCIHAGLADAGVDDVAVVFAGVIRIGVTQELAGISFAFDTTLCAGHQVNVECAVTAREAADYHVILLARCIHLGNKLDGRTRTDGAGGDDERATRNTLYAFAEGDTEGDAISIGGFRRWRLADDALYSGAAAIKQLTIADKAQHAGFDVAGLALQHPVAALVCGTGSVGGGGDVGAGEAGQFVDEEFALFALGEVAAVEQDIGIWGEVVRPGAEGGALCGEAVVIEGVGAEGEAAGGAVAEDVHRFKLPLGQLAANHIEAGFAALHHAHGSVGGQLVDDAFVVRHPRVDDDERGGRLCRFFHHFTRTCLRGRLGFLFLCFGVAVAAQVEIIRGGYGTGTVEQQARFECQSAAGGAEGGAGFFLHGRDLSKRHR